MNRQELWLANFKGETEVSKRIMSSGVKDNYKGDKYVPWARMFSALYQLDPEADTTRIMNDKGGFVFTDTFENKRLSKVQSKDNIEIKEDVQLVTSHFVKVGVKYLDKWFYEDYPIQDNAYGAPKMYDQNMVNKAHQRALTRLISLATGVAWELYEAMEVSQFEDAPAETDKKPVPPKKKTTVIVPTTDVMETVTDIIVKSDDEKSPVEVAASLLNDPVNKVKAGLINLVNNYNEVLSTKYALEDGTPLIIDLTNDDYDSLLSKLSLVNNVDKIVKGIQKVIK